MVPRLAVACLLAFVGGLSVVETASATTITVNSGSDGGGSGCTLRKAITASNTLSASTACPAGSGTDTIVLAVPKVTLSLGGTGDNLNVAGDLDVTGVVTIQGQAGGTVIDAAHVDRVLDVRSGGQVKLQDVTLTGGVAPAGANGSAFTTDSAGATTGDPGAPGEDGGAIRNAGVLALQGVTVSGNATSHGGAGFSPPVTVGAQSFAGPGGQGGSGGGIASSGLLTVTNSTISANTTGAGGAGAIGNGGNGTAASRNGHSGFGGAGGNGGDGGGISSTGTSSIADSVITANHTGAGGLAPTGTAARARRSRRAPAAQAAGGLAPSAARAAGAAQSSRPPGRCESPAA